MFETRIEPRVSETDGAGHINNTTIPIWFEAGRNKIFEMFTPDFSFENWRCVILHTSVDYVKQVFYGKEVVVKTWVKSIGNTSFVLYEELHQDGELCVKGNAVYVNFNLKTQSKEPIPGHIRKQLEEHSI
ncbi:thioesterase [Pueribacillus theae]|uniref:Thioesterase n=1 Tax=Pueribacillus theae TaxID=2171751 RepID=A0A2U1JZF5_9BACI|nr:thioesterase family protein [Pueribacillus theae]PWA10375.1 thioesterase [Pueribacillus theae]